MKYTCIVYKSMIATPFTVRIVEFMKKTVLWDVAPCRYGVNRRFGGTYRLHLQGRRENKKSASEETVRAGASRLMSEINSVI
jgi:hypothetical protein